MSHNEVCFNVYHGGYWVKDYNGEFAYLNGEEMIRIECIPEDVFNRMSTELREGLYGQKIWYKLPYDDFKDRKSLSNEDVSFQKMCEAGKWTGFVDLYVVNSTKHPHDVVVQEPCDAELRVERNAASFGDENPDFDYHNTPPNSDDEGDGGEEYVRCKRGSGQLKFRQVFDSLEDFKEALVDYALKEGCNIKLDRWGKEKSGAVCSIEGCLWRIYCSYEECISKWMVKTFVPDHSCVLDGYCKLLKAGVIAKLFEDDIRTDPDFRPRTMLNEIQKRYNLTTSIDKCKNAKKKVIEKIHQEHLEQFSRLRDYKDAILSTNHESTVELDTIINEDGAELFQRFYVCFAAIRKQWSMWCRPIFGIDGCFLKSTLKGQLLAAVGRDADNGMYPFAWAVVDVENEDNWTWFIKKLQKDFNLQEGQGYTVISDRQKGLLNAVERVLPHVELIGSD